MSAQERKRIIPALLLALVAAVLMAGCEEYGGHHHKNNKKTCYERVLNIDKKTGQTHYEERAVPCRK